jgi:hypothetical protein
MLGEGGPSGPVEVLGQSGDPREHLEGLDVEVGALRPPCRDQSVDLVLRILRHASECTVLTSR